MNAVCRLLGLVVASVCTLAQAGGGGAATASRSASLFGTIASRRAPIAGAMVRVNNRPL